MSIISNLVTHHTHCRSLTTPTVCLLTLAISEVCSDDNQRYSEGGGVLERLVLLIVVGELGRRGLDRIDGNRGDVSVTCMKGNSLSAITRYIIVVWTNMQYYRASTISK